jgi:hypothetical protein
MNRNLAILAATAMALASGAAHAQASATVSTTGSAKIIQAITIAKDSDLQFGTVLRPTAGTNTVTIDATTGGRTSSLGASGLATSTSGRAAYTVGGEGGQSFSITVGTLTLTHGTDTLPVTLTPTATTGTLSGTAGTSGNATFGVGGSFSVANTTTTGDYTGTFNVTVAYN